ncbi:bifunctional 4-hydroxy-2-oxoglutarate aldolase/2-dehydro-3-deoxy-phosphogluconate aldolase [Candidatus Bipolaricaulota bacterium]
MRGQIEAVAAKLSEEKVIAVVRIESADGIFDVVRALKAGGIVCIEITMTVPGASRIIEQLTADEPDLVVGAGTVLTRADAEKCLAAGATFLMSPICDPNVIRCGHDHGAAVLPGALTPTEIASAWSCGADFVKVFPASRMGHTYISELQGPLPQIPLVPTGGITDANAAQYLRAGAAAVCTGSWLVSQAGVSAGEYELIRDRARKIVAAVAGV